LYTTNPKTIRLGIEEKWANTLLLKVNQIETITDAMEAVSLILKEGQKGIVSHRSGETCNSVIADLAVAIEAQYLKTGSTARGERIEKYTRLLQIYDYLKKHNMLLE
jgi:enolase